jgi:hypothetical protein
MTGCFILCADGRLQQKVTIARMASEFGLAAGAFARSIGGAGENFYLTAIGSGPTV